MDFRKELAKKILKRNMSKPYIGKETYFDYLDPEEIEMILNAMEEYGNKLLRFANVNDAPEPMKGIGNLDSNLIDYEFNLHQHWKDDDKTGYDYDSEPIGGFKNY